MARVRTLLVSALCLLPDRARAEYRSAIFFNTPEQREIAERVTSEVQKKHFDPKGASVGFSPVLHHSLHPSSPPHLSWPLISFPPSTATDVWLDFQA